MMRVARLTANAFSSSERKHRAQNSVTPVENFSRSQRILKGIRIHTFPISTVGGEKTSFHDTSNSYRDTNDFLESSLLCVLERSFFITAPRPLSSRRIRPTLRLFLSFFSPPILLLFFVSGVVYTSATDGASSPKQSLLGVKAAFPEPRFERRDHRYPQAENANEFPPVRMGEGDRMHICCSGSRPFPQIPKGAESISGLLSSGTTTSTRPLLESRSESDGSFPISTAQNEERANAAASPTEVIVNGSKAHSDFLNSFSSSSSSSEADRLAGLGYILGPPYTGGGKPKAREEETKWQESAFSFTGQQSPPPDKASVGTFANHILDEGFISSENRDEKEQEAKDQLVGEFDWGGNNSELAPSVGSSTSTEERSPEDTRTQRKKTPVSKGRNASENRMKKSSVTVEFEFSSPPSPAPNPPQLLYLFPVVDRENGYVHLLPTMAHTGPFFLVPSGVDANVSSILPGASASAEERGVIFPETELQVDSTISTPIAGPERDDFPTQSLVIDGFAASNHDPQGLARSVNQAGVPLSGFLVPITPTSGLFSPAVNTQLPPHFSQVRHIGARGKTTAGRDARFVFHLPPVPSILDSSLASSLLYSGAQNGQRSIGTSSIVPGHQHKISLSPVSPNLSPRDVSHEAALSPSSFSGPSPSPLLSDISADDPAGATVASTASTQHQTLSSPTLLPPTLSARRSFAQETPESFVDQPSLAGQGTASAGKISPSSTHAPDYTDGPPTRPVGPFEKDSRTGSARQLVPPKTETNGAFSGGEQRPSQDSSRRDFIASNLTGGQAGLTLERLVQLARRHAPPAPSQVLGSEDPVISISTLLFPHQHDTDTSISWADSPGYWTASQPVLPQLDSLLSILTGLDRDLLWRFFTGPGKSHVWPRKRN
uniref:Transmembrane protein n=1 Tax=Neospora caninum (strain Liverpool) TaxID=572307 RepID=A0A0F7UIE2_NEOCL|nr:TPA: hypothetical protein BN1204_045255 [Neospora caninum Liverpool]